MEFENFKKIFNESFGKVTPDEFIQQMENLGYKFKASDTQNDSIGKCGQLVCIECGGSPIEMSGGSKHCTYCNHYW